MVYIPGFLVNKVYDRGSLRNTDDGFEFCFSNTMTPLKISGMRGISIEVDGARCPTDSLRLSLGGMPMDITGGGLEEAVSFGRGDKLTMGVMGRKLAEGKHVLKISFITNEYGGATLKVSDVVGESSSPSIWGRLKNFLGGKPDIGQSSSINITGELGGVPLDPDFSRLEAALRREEADRVPLFEAEIAPPIQEWFLGKEVSGVADVIEFYVKAGYDFVPALPPFFAPRLMRTAAESDDSMNEADRERAWLKESEGLIRTVADVEKFPWPMAEEVDFSIFEEVAALLPPKMKILGMLSPCAVFGNASQAMGLENFCYALYDDTSVVEALFEIVGSTYVKIAEKLAVTPRVGAVLMSDDLAFTEGTFAAPEVYRKYVFPWYRKIGETLDNAGIPFIFHSDGNLIPILDDLADCGVKAIHPIEPKAMDIVEVKKNFGDRFCIFGNIDLEYTLTRGTVEEVEAQVRQRIRDLAPGGGWGLAASNSVPDYVKPENYRAMVETGKKYGKYPITV